jgi:hypothetical protein
MRALHVLDAGRWRWQCGGAGSRGDSIIPDPLADETAALCALAVTGRHEEHGVLLLGPGWFVRRAHSLGLRASAITCPTSARAELAARQIRRAARMHCADVICCWSARCERAAVLALGREAPVLRVRMADEAPGRGPLGRSLRRAVVEPGLAADPPFEPAGEASRREMRFVLGLRQEVAVLLLGDAVQASGPRFAFTLDVIRCAGTRVVGLLPRWSDQIHRVQSFLTRQRSDLRLVQFSHPSREVEPAADLALWVGGGRSSTWLTSDSPPRIQVARCLAAGVPVVAPADIGLDDLYPPVARGTCLAETGLPPELGRKLMLLAEDTAARTEIARACRAFWRGRQGAAAFRAELDHACRTVATTGGWAEVVARQVAAAPGAAR